MTPPYRWRVFSLQTPTCLSGSCVKNCHCGELCFRRNDSYSWEPLNKSSAAEQRIFCSLSAVWKIGNTYSIPRFPKLSEEAKSLAVSSCRFNQSFPKEPLNNSATAGWRVFCPIRAVPKLGNTQSIPAISVLSAEPKSLATSSCRIIQRFPNRSKPPRSRLGGF